MEALMTAISKELIGAEEMRIEIKRIDVSTKYEKKIKHEKVSVDYEVFICKYCEKIGKPCFNTGSDILSKINYQGYCDQCSCH